LNTVFSYAIYNKANELPENWNTLANENIFLTKEYLEVLEKSCPINMQCFFIGLFLENEIVGIALSQFLDLNKLESFGERDKCIKSMVRNYVFKKFSSHVLFLGNNMLTGQNAFIFSKEIDYNKAIQTVKLACDKIQSILLSRGIKIHLITCKDFLKVEVDKITTSEFKKALKFSTQPNMVFTISENWKTEQDYVNVLSKKYRDQYKRARKKAVPIEKRKLELSEIIEKENTIYELYHHVAKNAPFNSFFLARNHFELLKKALQNDFLFYGYFLDQKLIGFNTLIKNGDTMDTYFLGYEESIQREKMLYLNMLYDMIGYSIKKGFKQIVFGRTALEIKSGIGAKPIKMYGLMKHKNLILNRYIGNFFAYLEPKTVWQERNPFK
jgi:predicted N-acyltransferase